MRNIDINGCSREKEYLTAANQHSNIVQKSMACRCTNSAREIPSLKIHAISRGVRGRVGEAALR